MNKSTGTRPLRGLEKVCKTFGTIKCGSTVMVWDYANDVAVPQKDMRPGSLRWQESERAKWNTIKAANE